MDCTLTKLGFKNPESLKEFATRYPDLPFFLEEELEKIWICHKNHKEIPVFHNVFESENEDFNNVQKNIIKNFNPLLTEFNPGDIFGKIYFHFGKSLTWYIFTKCFVFYNWGVNSYEPVLNHLDVAQRIEKKLKLRGNKIIKTKRKKCDGCNNPEQSKTDSGPPPSNTVSYSKFRKAIECSEQYKELQRNPSDPSQETFNLNKILYDLNEKPKWPSRHILSFCTVETFMEHIIQIPTAMELPEGRLDCCKWNDLRGLLEVFVKNHRRVEKNYGYGRILKGHLKKAKLHSSHKLNPIPKTTINSFVIDVIRKTLPLELFGCNRLRKKFFSEVIKVINGHKMENFMWFSLLRHFFQHKDKIRWCREIKNDQIQNVVLLKLFKFIILEYILVILKNNFYITETGTSCYALRFYRKGEIESVSSVCINNLLHKKQLRNYKKRDFDRFSVERRWIDTGVVDERDLNKKGMEFMEGETEFKQPIAKVRFLPKSDFADELRIITHLPERRKIGGGKCEEIVGVFKRRLKDREEELVCVKLFLEYLVQKYGVGIKPVPSNALLEKAWRKAQCLKERFGNLYFVKADITDAFGSICQNLLMDILSKYFEKTPLQLKKITEWRIIRGKLTKITRQSYSNRPQENSILINRTTATPPKHKNIQYLNIIKQQATEQRIEIKGRVYKLIKGLAQGSVGKFSPQLCELYYSAMDKLHFQHLLNSENSILLRGVDDYLLITTDLKKAESFLRIVESGIKQFNVEFNEKKLKSNLLEDIKEVSYLGLVFNFENMLVNANYSKLNRNSLVSRVKLTDRYDSFYFNKKYFLWKKSLQINSLKLEDILLKNKYNDAKETRRIVYRASVLQTLRVVSFVKYLHRNSVKNEVHVFEMLRKSCGKIINSAGVLPGDEVEWLFYSAVLKVVEKFSGGLKNLLVMSKFQLGVCERRLLKNDFQLLVDIWKRDLLDFQIDLRDVFNCKLRC